jgi:hypothetical protein
MSMARYVKMKKTEKTSPESGRIEKMAPKIRTSASVGGAIFRDETALRSAAGQESGYSGKEIC